MIEKEKLLENAQKFLNKGRIDDAIIEYEKILEITPAEHTIRLKLAELYIRKGLNEKAIDEYVYVAEEYEKSDLFTKAIGIYNQIIKIDEKKLGFNIKIGKLYEKLGLTHEAIKQYKIVSKIYEEKNRKKENLEVLKSILDLDPYDISYRIKLAEAYYRNNFIPDSISECKSIIDDIEKFYFQKGKAKQAISKLNELFEKGFKDPEILRLISDAFYKFGENLKALSLYNKLASFYEFEGKEKERINVLEKIQNIKKEERESPEHKQDDKVEEISEHLEEVSFCIKFGLIDRALREIDAILHQQPGNLSAKEYLEKILSMDQSNSKAKEMLDSIVTIDNN